MNLPVPLLTQLTWPDFVTLATSTSLYPLMYPYENSRRTTAQVMERSDDDVPTFKWVIFRFYVSGANPAGVQADQNVHVNLGGGFQYVLFSGR